MSPPRVPVLLSRLANRFASRTCVRDEAADKMAIMLSAIHFREMQGQTTTLRQLHQISEMPQPEALSLVDKLQKSGIVEIETNLGDAFESRVTLNGDTRKRMNRASTREAA